MRILGSFSRSWTWSGSTTAPDGKKIQWLKVRSRPKLIIHTQNSFPFGTGSELEIIFSWVKILKKLHQVFSRVFWEVSRFPVKLYASRRKVNKNSFWFAENFERLICWLFFDQSTFIFNMNNNKDFKYVTGSVIFGFYGKIWHSKSSLVSAKQAWRGWIGTPLSLYDYHDLAISCPRYLLFDL